MTPWKKRLTNEAITLVLVLGVLLVAYALLVEHLDIRWDLTSAGQFSLSETTGKILSDVRQQDHKINVYVFYRPDKNPEEGVKRRKLFDLLEQYHYRTGKKVALPRVLNPDQHPEEVQRFGVRNVGTVVFDMEDKDGKSIRKQIVAPRDIWGIRLIDGRPGPEEFKGENAFSSALKRLLAGKQRAVFFVTGHREFELPVRETEGLRDLGDALELFNYSTRLGSLIQEGKVPASADVVVIAGPKSAFFPAEEEILLQYAQHGGHLLILADSGVSLGLDRLMKYLGVELGHNMVMEPTRAFQGNLITPVPLYGSDHPVVKDLQSSGENVLLNTARTVERALGDTRGITTKNLLVSSPEAWGEVSFGGKPGGKKEVRYDAGSGDLKGPVTMALAVTRASEAGETRAVVVGDAELATNQMIKFGANKDFLLNAVHWLVGAEDDIGISPKDPQFNFVTITNRQVWVVFTIVILLVPGLVLTFGVLQWLNRRSL